MTNKKRKRDQKSDPVVFISYARRPDLQFVGHLCTFLRKARLKPWIDTQKMLYGEDWRREIRETIRVARSVIFIVSPQSIASKNCNEELNLSLEYGKKIIPLLRRPTEPMPVAIRNLHYLEILDDSDLETKFSALLAALKTNRDWDRQHTRLLSKALDYKSAPKDNRHEILLSQYEFDEAQQWLQSVIKKDENRIVPLIRRFLYESKKHIIISNRNCSAYAEKISNEFNHGTREWSEITREMAELPMIQRTNVYSVVVRDAIRHQGGRMGDHFFYLLGDLPKALKFGKSHWESFIQTVLLDGRFQYSVIFSLIADNTFPIRSFFAACELTILSGQPTGPTSHPIRTVTNAMGFLQPDFMHDNFDLVDRLFKYAYSRAHQVCALIPIDTELERVQAEALRDGIDTPIVSIARGIFEEREPALNSAYVLLYDILESMYSMWDDLCKKFDPSCRLHLLGRLAVSFASNRHWGTAYEACKCLWELPLYETSMAEMMNWTSYYQDEVGEQSIRNPKRRRYARRKSLEVLAIMHDNGAPILWPALIMSRLGLKPMILNHLEVLRSEDRKIERDSLDTFAQDVLEDALKGKVQPFGFTQYGTNDFFWKCANPSSSGSPKKRTPADVGVGQLNE